MSAKKSPGTAPGTKNKTPAAKPDTVAEKIAKAKKTALGKIPVAKRSAKKATAAKKTAAGKKAAEKLPPEKRLIRDLIQQVAVLEDKHLRLQAEFDNYRRRREKEIGDLLKYEGVGVIKAFLPVLDDLERLSEAIHSNGEESIQTLREGIDLILSKLHKRFTEQEILPFTEPGEILDSKLHDALMVRNEQGRGENEILEVFEKGYRYKDRVIRHAKVIVNKTK